MKGSWFFPTLCHEILFKGCMKNCYSKMKQVSEECFIIFNIVGIALLYEFFFSIEKALREVNRDVLCHFCRVFSRRIVEKIVQALLIFLSRAICKIRKYYSYLFTTDSNPIRIAFSYRNWKLVICISLNYSSNDTSYFIVFIYSISHSYGQNMSLNESYHRGKFPV